MISFIVPCFNEENRIVQTISEIDKACSKVKIDDHKIYIVDDCSVDNSEQVIKNEIKLKSHIIYHRNIKNMGFGGAAKIGLYAHNDSYLMWLPGDNAHPASELVKILEKFTSRKVEYDIISTFYGKNSHRNFFRKFFTNSYTPLLNFIFGLKIPYYNGLSIIKKSVLDQIKIKTNAHCWQVELWVKASNKKNFQYLFVETQVIDPSKNAAAFKFINSIKVIYNIIRLFFLNIILKFSD